MRMPSCAGGQLELFPIFLLLGDVLGKDENAAHGSLRGAPGVHLPAEPLEGEVIADKAVLVTIQIFAGQGAAMQDLPAVRDFREDFVVGAADQALGANSKVLQPAPAGGEVAHIAIEHGDRRGCVVDKELE
jgi:hypothetical protein